VLKNPERFFSGLISPGFDESKNDEGISGFFTPPPASPPPPPAGPAFPPSISGAIQGLSHNAFSVQPKEKGG